MNRFLDGRILKKVVSSSFAEIKEKYDVNDVEIRLLLALDERSNIDTAKELEDVLLVTKGAISVAIQDLVNKELIIRNQDTNNRKVIHLKLTKKSQDVINESKIKKDEMFNKVYDGITNKQKEVMKEVFNIIDNNIKAKF